MKISIKQKVLLLKLLIHISAFLPLAYLYYQALNDQLGADPVQRVIHFTGIGAFNLLLLTLTVSPLAKYFKRGYLLQVRRLLGLYTFFYALFHVLNFLAFDLQFAWGVFIGEVFKRPYISIGMVAFLLLSALAITSLNSIKRKMGRAWQSLHNFSYLILILIAVHFYWSVKSEILVPLFYGLLSFTILLFRYKKLQQLFMRLFS
ncbi:protein-methionine-sulfoxide reductase heme-binding subunit MsrQ [Colwellia sp. D2M02]|uniref:protein-methionine-sulfoxide reductase heme-binding subunit MsrQ n=1 Tax=Colwellia sp. D2M02 TaxID=2841562 RepID=UPI001C09EAA3|nr:protein-methionine-sulfoxide reductase heme-binding subunit MsrQ [Colwellia sp. D2M02]MBU2894501.1 protein-methionine-sulfoxide reductase heme-binding subunit MsrQ [Colwellia sp. D2M02]